MRCTIAASLQMSDEPEFFPQKTRDSYRHKKEDISFEISSSVFESLLSDSNQRPRDYKSRALASWAKEAGGKALHIAPLQLTTFAAIKPWRIRKELAVWHFPMWWDAFLLVCIAKERIYFESTKFQCVFLIITHQNPLFRLPKASFFCVPYRIPLTFHTNANFFCKQHLSPQIYFLTLYGLFTLVDLHSPRNLTA